jgi:hypothetical protein
LERVLISTQDSCIVCTKCPIGSKIIFGHTRWNSMVTWVEWKLAHPMDFLGDVGQMEAHFGPFGDNVNQHAR